MVITVMMKSGKFFKMDVNASGLEQLNQSLNKAKFIRFGPIILNTSEIEYIEQVAN